MKVQTKRILSFLLVLVVFCSALLPAMIPPVRAVAVVDDAAIAIGLLFAGFAGITFSRSDYAVQAIQKFMTDCADAATEIVYLAQNCVKDGVLQLVADAKMRYQTIITAMSAFFVSSADASGALSGSMSLGASYKPIKYVSSAYTADLFRFSVGENVILNVGGGDMVWTLKHEGVGTDWPSLRLYRDGKLQHMIYADNGKTFLSGRFDVIYSYNESSKNYNVYVQIASLYTDGSSRAYLTTGNGFTWTLDSLSSVSITQAGDNITYLQDAAVDGTSALNRMNEIPEPDKDPDNDDKPVEIPMVPFPITKELEIAKTGQNKDADGNPLVDANGNPLVDADGNPLSQQKPGIIPSELIDELTKLVEQSKTDTPDTPNNPDTDDDRTKRHDADWKNVFPFCVPFDLIEFIGVLAAEPVAPAFDWRFYAPNVVDYTMHIDLSSFDDVARICRTLELLAFCIGLILITRNIIRG